MQIDLSRLPFPSTRQPVFATRGMIATSQPLAAQVGMAILQRGGSAVDAAIATAVALTVVEPTSNGIGGEALARGSGGPTLPGAHRSGRPPRAPRPRGLRRGGHTRRPGRRWHLVSVAGGPG